MAGLNKYEDKRKRATRRRNHVARDLASPLFRPRVVDKKGREKTHWRKFLEISEDTDD